MPSVKKKYLLISAILFVGVFAVLGYIFVRQLPKPLPQNQLPVSAPQVIPSLTLPIEASSANNTKTYTNADYGFEFQYPDDLIVQENTFGSYYSKFNLQVEYWNKEGKYLSVFDVNVVLPEFADRTFLSIGATTSTIVVDGVLGIKYEYEFESLSEVAVVLLLGQYKVILGIGGSSKFYGHESAFNQILASFKFLR
ncbi:MAG: hypothetical protein Q8N28_02680 [bacterium]|nr:hypothetical protein [bacterium]